MLTFSSRVICATIARAFSYALDQLPDPVPHGDGYFGGEVNPNKLEFETMPCLFSWRDGIGYSLGQYASVIIV